MIVAGTGHRRIPHPHDRLVSAIALKLRHLGAKKVISGMALGWDMALADAAVLMHIPLIAAVPFPAQPDLWAEADQALYHRLLGKAESIHYISEFTVLAAYEARNRWMIDRADLVLAYWDGSLLGGTSNAIRYAHRPKVQKHILNMFGASF